MALFSSRELAQQARSAGFQVLAVEQLRPSRWLLTLTCLQNRTVLVMFQQRALIGAADVQDLADLVRLRRAGSGLLVAPGATFSAAARQTLSELRDVRMWLCTSLPSAGEASEPRGLGVVVQSPLS
jgi:2-keto-3-deoxy-6-phosphogluconate aldolase